jgi:hypothetical protein
VYELVKTVFAAAAITCFLSGMHRIAAALKLGARVEVLDRMGDAFTAEEREALVHRIKSRSLTSW